MRKRDQNSNAIRQLNEYLAGKRKTFTVPLHFMGTPFQLKVWDELRRIPYGETRSYGELAGRVGNLKAQRAVGMANNKNPIAILVPCHRVIGKDGSLTGYAGGLELKRRLLELEGVLSV
jgi:methylated-DNA-[protein]-cysteine S-methyltransferase